MPGARFFTWVQRARFYVDLHREAVSLLPPGDDRTWLDVGTGPGLVAGLAAERGYDALGIDKNPAMVAAARGRFPGARFEEAALPSHPTATYDVVSAASLLIVVPDPRAAARALWEHVRPGGHLLLVETTARMNPRETRPLSVSNPLVLWLWARVRQGRAVDIDALGLPGERQQHLLLEGAVAAWVWRR